jgi:hypothetical protein
MFKLFNRPTSFKDRELRLTIGGMQKFREVTGKSLLKGEVNVAELTEKDIICLIWSLMIWDDPRLTMEQVGYMVGNENLTEVYTKIGKALNPNP